MRISSEQWIQLFKKLHSNIDDLNPEQEHFKRKFKNEEPEIVTKFELFDHSFIEKEVSGVLKKLRNNKSAADDRVRNEMIKFFNVSICLNH